MNVLVPSSGSMIHRNPALVDPDCPLSSANTCDCGYRSRMIARIVSSDCLSASVTGEPSALISISTLLL